MERASLIMLRGLPASGKTTVAENFISNNTNCVRLNRDSLRNMMYFACKGNSLISGNQENGVIVVQRSAAIELLNEGFSVIIDDTNVEQKHYNRWKEIADITESDFLVYSLLETVNIEECIRRDAEREDGVGEDAIINLARRADILNRK